MERGLRGDLLSQRAEITRLILISFKQKCMLEIIYYICSILSKIVIKIMETGDGTDQKHRGATLGKPYPRSQGLSSSCPPVLVLLHFIRYQFFSFSSYLNFNCNLVNGHF